MTGRGAGLGWFLALLCVAGFGMCGCGSDDDGPVAFDRSNLRVTPPADARRGGELTVLAAGDVDSLDPGSAANQFSFMLADATQRRLLT